MASVGSVELPSWLHLDYSEAFELALALLCVVYAVVFWRGYRANTRLAEAFRGAFVEACSAEFSRIGLKKAEGGEAKLLRDGATRFLSYATGRANCLGLTAVLELAPRMDLFARLKGLWAPVRPDALSLLAPVERMPPLCVWLVGRRRWQDLEGLWARASTAPASCLYYCGVHRDFDRSYQDESRADRPNKPEDALKVRVAAL